jgi:MFS family permease
MSVSAAHLPDKRRAYGAIAGLRNRWWIVAASVVALTVGQGTIELYCFGIFLKPLSDDIGLTRGTLSSGLLTASVSTALATPIVGLLIDRYGGRAVMLPGIAAFALAMAARSILQSSPLYEPSIDRGQGLSGLCPLALGFQKIGDANCRPQLQELRFLTPGLAHGVNEALLCCA